MRLEIKRVGSAGWIVSPLYSRPPPHKRGLRDACEQRQKTVGAAVKNIEPNKNTQDKKTISPTVVVNAERLSDDLGLIRRTRRKSGLPGSQCTNCSVRSDLDG